ncbi:MAG TPA: hypothetical protein VMZ27_06725 [Candidatus Saccharimonadales bacterium]|nr:hypothetical protein [Candidatus Saccharimonadales bacterium]
MMKKVPVVSADTFSPGICLLLGALLIAGCANQPPPGHLSPLGYSSGYPFHAGEFGGSLDLLSSFKHGPAVPGESNYFIDMWDSDELQSYARAHGLTNNHALFVISHAETLETKAGPRFAYFPDQHHWRGRNKPHYSARDLARVLGPAKAGTIHNLVIAGCDVENSFSIAEMRHYFPNATNITHSVPGNNAHEQLFRHALSLSSKDIKTLYEMPDQFAVGNFSNKWQRKKIRPYVAELFRPGSMSPFKIQTAGRETLEEKAAN